MGYTRSEAFNSEDFHDFQIANVRDIVEYFQDYSDDSLDSKAFEVSNPVDGVRISCDGDMRNFGQNKFEPVSIPESHQIFTSGSISEIADRVNLPLLIYQMKADQQWKDDGFGYTNEDVTFLFSNIDLEKDYSRKSGELGWGWVPMRWQDDVGSVLVVRRDHAPLHCIDIEVLCAFCRHLLPLFENTMGAGYERWTQDQVMAKITPAEYAVFAAFSERCKEEERSISVDETKPYQTSPVVSLVVSDLEED
ncbi:MAG: hypothetical protein LQ350_007102 [Teloschistes chrysophthalmus]|nr:MAG: hypothetical protein LQ350_007102 [Niorma chrysophthalma]